MHAKRQTTSKFWPIPRKGTKYVVVPSHEKKNGVPLLIILRDMLKVTENRKEVRKILQEKLVHVNNKLIGKENFSVLPFDIIKLADKSYELVFSDKGKFEVRETTRKEMVLKVVGKKILKNKKIQINLLYGKNIISDEKVKVGDSVVIKEKKIAKILHLEKGKEVIIFAGKYKGKEGKIEKIENKMAMLECEKKKINIPIKNIMVIK